MNETVPLVIAFIAIIFFIGITENIAEFIIDILTRIFKKYISEIIGFIFVLVLSYLISMYGDFRFFEYLNVSFKYNWMDWGMSAAVIAAGSGFLEKKFDIINTIPSVITGIRVNNSKRKNKENEESNKKKYKNTPTI